MTVITAVQDGDWSEASTWDGGVPGGDDHVELGGFSVMLDDQAAAIACSEIRNQHGGRLTMPPDASRAISANMTAVTEALAMIDAQSLDVLGDVSCEWEGGAAILCGTNGQLSVHGAMSNSARHGCALRLVAGNVAVGGNVLNCGTLGEALRHEGYGAALVAGDVVNAADAGTAVILAGGDMAVDGSILNVHPAGHAIQYDAGNASVGGRVQSDNPADTAVFCFNRNIARRLVVHGDLLAADSNGPMRPCLAGRVDVNRGDSNPLAGPFTLLTWASVRIGPLHCCIGSDFLQVRVYNGVASASARSSPNGTWINGTTTIYDGAWHLIALRFDGAAYVLYVDGQPEASAALGPPDGCSTLYLGDADAPGLLLSETMIFTRALSDEEIAGLYNGGAILRGDPDAAPWNDRLWGAWRLDNQYNNMPVSDYSGNGRDAADHDHGPNWVATGGALTASNDAAVVVGGRLHGNVLNCGTLVTLGPIEASYFDNRYHWLHAVPPDPSLWPGNHLDLPAAADVRRGVSYLDGAAAGALDRGAVSLNTLLGV